MKQEIYKLVMTKRSHYWKPSTKITDEGVYTYYFKQNGKGAAAIYVDGNEIDDFDHLVDIIDSKRVSYDRDKKLKEILHG